MAKVGGIRREGDVDESEWESERAGLQQRLEGSFEYRREQVIPVACDGQSMTSSSEESVRGTLQRARAGVPRAGRIGMQLRVDYKRGHRATSPRIDEIETRHETAQEDNRSRARIGSPPPASHLGNSETQKLYLCISYKLSPLLPQQLPDPNPRMPKIKTSRTKPPPEGFDEVSVALRFVHLFLGACQLLYLPASTTLQTKHGERVR